MRLTPQQAKLYLLKIASSLPQDLSLLCCDVLNDAAFNYCSAAAKHHHAYAGGLIVHTAEVVEFVVANSMGVDLSVVVVSAIFHDYAKIYDYEECEVSDRHPKGWKTTASYTRDGHIYMSNAVWKQRTSFLPPIIRHAISHAILAHHGKIEWGSPFTPQTAEAKLLHQADMFSTFEGEGRERYDGQ
jgi:3'-5' exoribonuclease